MTLLTLTPLLLVASGALLAVSLMLLLRMIAQSTFSTVRADWRLVLCLGLVCICGTVAMAVCAVTAPAERQLPWFGLLSLCLCGLSLLLVIMANRSVRAFVQSQKVKGSSIHDPLTQVHNRAYLEHRLEQEISRAQRYGAPLSVFAVDILGFNQFKDEFGHHASNIALVKLAARLEDCLRETDVVARYQPDTFVLVLPDTPEASISALQMRLRSELENLVVLDCPDQRESAITVSVNFGCAHCQLSTRDARQLLQQAMGSLRHPVVRISEIGSDLNGELSAVRATVQVGADVAQPEPNDA